MTLYTYIYISMLSVTYKKNSIFEDFRWKNCLRFEIQMKQLCCDVRATVRRLLHRAHSRTLSPFLVH